MVAYGHAWAAIAAHEPGAVSRFLWALADTRHSWVVIFFVLSGYLVGGNALLRSANFDFKAYAVARFSRIYIVLIPALIMTACLDGMAWVIDPTNPIYAGDWGDSVFGDVPPFARYTAGDIAASILSLEGVIGAPMGTAGPLWSLGFEWIFYFCFPPLMVSADYLARRVGHVWLMRAAVMAASVILLAGIGRYYAALLWIIWVGGAVAHVIAEKGWWPQVLRWVGLVVCLGGFVAGLHIDYRFADLLIGAGFISFLACYPRGERGINHRLDQTMASGSYSLYVIHLPLIAFVCLMFNRAGLLPNGGAPISPLMIAMLLTAAAIVAATCCVYYWLFERNTDALRRVLLRKPRLQRA